MMEKQTLCCEYCTKLFEKKNYNHKCCSESCQVAIYRKTAKENDSKRYNIRKKAGNICITCGKIINAPYVINQSYCMGCKSKNLLLNRNRRGILENRYEITNCIICGISILDMPAKCKYCSRCRSKMKEIWNSTEWKENRGIDFFKHKIMIK
jgi:hypothetical protein